MQHTGDSFEGPLARYPFVDTEDAETARARISSLLLSHDLDVHRGLLPFRAVHRHVALDAISLHYVRYEPEVTLSCSAPRWFYVLVVPISGLCRVGSARRPYDVAPGQCAVINPDTAPRLHMIGNCQAIIVKIPSAEISGRFAGDGGRAAATGLEFEANRAVPEEACGGLIDLVLWMCRDANHASSVSLDPMLGRRVEALLIETVLAVIPHDRAVADAPAIPKPAPQNLRRCEEFVELHAADPIAIADMTEVSGASERTLFQAFRDHRQTTPMAYLKARRLEGAHADLVRADADENTVSEIAGAWGFAHPGHFAREYRRKFGRTPSHTLRRERHPGYPGTSDS